MASGGARNRSGPSPDPTSATSDRRGLSFLTLPVDGFKGRAPAFPRSGSARAKQLWVEAWKSPQGAVWIEQSWRWPVIAEYCLLMEVVESEPGGTAALVGQLHRYRDQLGLTPAGLRENGWQIGTVVSDVKPKGAKKPQATGSRARYLKAVGGSE